MLDVKAGTWKSLIPNASQAQYVSSGHLVYVAGEALWAVAFDLSRLEPAGVATRRRSAGLDTADRHSRIRCRSRRHVGVRDGRWRGFQAATRVGRSGRKARRDCSDADPTLRRCAAVAGWLTSSGSDRRWRQRYLGLGSGPRDVDAGDHRSGCGPLSPVDARWPTPDLHARRQHGCAVLAGGGRKRSRGAPDREFDDQACDLGSQRRQRVFCTRRSPT